MVSANSLLWCSRIYRGYRKEPHYYHLKAHSFTGLLKILEVIFTRGAEVISSFIIPSIWHKALASPHWPTASFSGTPVSTDSWPVTRLPLLFSLHGFVSNTDTARFKLHSSCKDLSRSSFALQIQGPACHLPYIQKFELWLALYWIYSSLCKEC